MIKKIMLVLVFLVVPGYAVSADLGYMRISLIEGDVQLKTPEAGDWGYAAVNTPLAEGDQIWVPENSRVELQLNSGNYIRLDQGSALQILSMDEDSSQFYLSQGYAFVFYDAPTRRSVIQVDTPDASTRAFENAIFRIDMSELYTDVTVHKGYVETENNIGHTRINAGEMLSLGQNTTGAVRPMGSPDDWERWNKERHEGLFAVSGESSRYLPAELSTYSHDFDNSGRWVQVPDYGHVWTPTVDIGISWTPYRDGSWVWRRGDYVWVGSESWGWAPYHYGRWSFGVNVGWFWVPPVTSEVYWSPGYVGWVRTPDYVAWVPLAPGDIYYGRGHYGRNSVNITNVNINQVNITNVYKNVNINNAVTVINRDTFNTNSPTIAKIDKNVIQEKIFVRDNISVGTPDIKPTKANYFPTTKQIKREQLPPQPVRNLKVEKIKQARPLIKDQDKSVFNPGDKRRSLPVNSVTTPKKPGEGQPMIQQVKPGEMPKDATRAVVPADKGQIRQMEPAQRLKPAPGDGPAGRIQKKEPIERVRPAIPEGLPADRGQTRQMEPAQRVKPAPGDGPTGRGQRPQLKPPAETERPAVREFIPTDRGQRPEAKPAEREKTAPAAVGPTGRSQKSQVEPARQQRPAPPAVKPAERERPAVREVVPTDRGQRPQVKPAERERPAPAVKPERDQIRQVEPARQQRPAPPAVRPAERERPAVREMVPTDRGQRQVKPDERERPAPALAKPPERSQIRQVEPARQQRPAPAVVTPAPQQRPAPPVVKPAPQQRPAPPVVKPAPQQRPAPPAVKPAAVPRPVALEKTPPQSKGAPECGPGQKDEKNPKKCP